MAQGLPSNFTTLYDEQGNAVRVSIDPTGNYALAVRDETTQKLLDVLSQNSDLLRGILMQLSAISGSSVGLE